MAYPGLAHEEHKYLGKEYCTGYTDVYGKWNTGFYCPQYGSKTAVFCCGTAVFKYCCTNQEPVDLSSSNGGVLLDGDDPNFDHPHGSGVSSAVFVRVPIVFGVVCGITAVLILLLVAGCYFCSCCFAYKKRRNDMISDSRHHHLHMNHQHQLPPFGNSGHGGGTLLNLYSPGATTTGPLTTRSSLVTTPLDLDWTSSLASSYQSQQQLYAPLQYPPPPGSSPGLSPAAAAIAAALSQRSSHSPAGSSLLYGTSGTPSVISGSLPASSQGTGRLPSSQAYQGYLNSSTSTLSSVPPPSISLPRGNNPTVGQPSLHRGTLPQQMSTTASIVNSYLASLQQAQLQTHAPPEQQPPPPVIQVDRTRHPSPPPSYFQSVSSASSYPSNRNSTGNTNRNSNMNTSSNRTGRMATIQSILGGSNSGGNSYSGFNWNNEENLLIADFLLRHENTLRRSLGLSNNSSSNASSNNRTNNTSSTNNNNRNTHRGNPMLSQRELIELLLRLTCNTNSSTSSITRSDSGVGSDTNSTTSSVTTTRSTSSSSGKLPTSHTAAPTTTPNNKSVTICEVDEDNDTGQDVSSNSATTTAPNANVNHPVNGKIKASLDLALSRMSVVDNDSGVPSSTCSTAGSEGAECLIGSIRMISRDLSEDAIKLNKQHALDDDSSCVGGPDDGNLTNKFQQQLAASTIHTETNCARDGNGVDCGGGGSDGEIMIIESSHHPSSPPPTSGDHHHNCNSDHHSGKDINNGVTFENPTLPHRTTSPVTVQEV